MNDSVTLFKGNIWKNSLYSRVETQSRDRKRITRRPYGIQCECRQTDNKLLFNQPWNENFIGVANTTHTPLYVYFFSDRIFSRYSFLNLLLWLIHSVIKPLVTRITRQRCIRWPQTKKEFIVHLWWLSIGVTLCGKRRGNGLNTSSFFFCKGRKFY